MSELKKIIRTSQETFNEIINGEHETHTYDNDNMYQVALEDPLILGADNSGLTIDEANNKLLADLRKIKINNVEQTIVGGAVNIPVANHTTFGVIKVNSAFGIQLSNGALSTLAASNTFIEGKTNSYNPIVPSNLDKAIMEGLGNNSLTWSDAYKAAARTTIGAGTGNGDELTSNKVTSLTSSSTDVQYPSAKATYDAIENVREIAEGKTKTYVVSYTTNPLFNSQADTVVLDGSFTDIDGSTHTVSELKRSDNILVSELDVPDRWVANIANIGPAADTEGSSTQASTPTPDNPVSIVSTTLKDVDENNVELRNIGTYKDTYISSNTLITRNVGVKVFVGDASEGWIYGAYGLTLFSCSLTNNTNAICSHFGKGNEWNSLNDGQFCPRGTATQVYFRYNAMNGDVTAFTAWLAAQYAAGTPVTVLYPLETPTTETKQLYVSSETPLAFLQKLETAKQKVSDVQVNGTSVLNPTTCVANIPAATNTTLGVVKGTNNGGLGVGVGTDGVLYAQQASSVDVTQKTNQYKPITPYLLDSAIKEGLGNYNLGTEGANAWSDTYKAHAREVIGAGIPNTTKLNNETVTTETTEVLTQAEFDAKLQAGTLVKGVVYKIKGSAQEKLISGVNLKTLNNQSLLGSGNININTAVWGNITGTLSNQSDLQTALDAKSSVSVSATGTATNEVSYITVNGTAYKLAGGGSASGAVRYDTAQSLTSAQQMQARSNIGMIVEVLADDDV